MMSSGYLEAYSALGNSEYLQIATRNIEFILKHQVGKDGRLLHNYKNGKSSINGYLEDYAFTIEALLNLYQSNFQEKYLKIAKTLLEIAREDFYDEDTGMFYFTSGKDRPLVTKPMEINDNVIPASNSVMANNLFKIGKLTGDKDLMLMAEKMVQNILNRIPEYPQSYSNWMDLLMNFTYPFFEVAITGEKFKETANFFQAKYLPNKVLTATDSASDLALLKDRLVKGKDLIYVCQEGSCQLPLKSKSEALQLISQV